LCNLSREFEQRQLRAIREELDRAHTERVRPVACPSASAFRQIIQQQSDLTGYDVFFRYVFLEIFGTFRTAKTGGG
jgi:hypothetical protein